MSDTVFMVYDTQFGNYIEEVYTSRTRAERALKKIIDLFCKLHSQDRYSWCIRTLDVNTEED